MRQLESLLQNISATEREEALQYYNEYFNDAGPENEQNVIEALGNPAKVAENIKKDILWNGYGENSYQRAGADSRSVITYPADPQTENGNGEQRNRQSDASQTAQAQVVSPQKNEGMSTGMIVLIVILCILASPVILGAASAGIGVAAGLIAAWFGLIIGFGATAAALILVLIALVAAGIISMFEDEEEQREAAELFHTTLPELSTRQERERAFHDILLAVKKNSYQYYMAKLGTDVNAVKQAVEGKKALEELQRTHISLE